MQDFVHQHYLLAELCSLWGKKSIFFKRPQPGAFFRGLTKHRCSHQKIEKPCLKNFTNGALPPGCVGISTRKLQAFHLLVGLIVLQTSALHYLYYTVSNCVEYSLKTILSNSLASAFLKKIPFILEITVWVRMHSHVNWLQWICRETERGEESANPSIHLVISTTCNWVFLTTFRLKDLDQRSKDILQGGQDAWLDVPKLPKFEGVCLMVLAEMILDIHKCER